MSEEEFNEYMEDIDTIIDNYKKENENLKQEIENLKKYNQRLQLEAQRYFDMLMENVNNE